MDAARLMFERRKADEIFYQQNGAPPHYHLAVSAFLDDNLQRHWSPALTPMHFYLWGTVKDQVHRRKSCTLEELRQEMTAAAACAAMFIEVTTAIARCFVSCLTANGQHFEHLQ
ncbi:hypothetical protein C0J52_14371 [Blattella germanica]|nr:hypothetical protein C0J52_14371 [Blattella germanica]